MTKTLNFNIDPIEAAARDMLQLSEADGNFSMPAIVWLLVRTCTTGKQMGGIVMYPDELTEARQRLGKLLDVAVAGGWRGMDLLETLMAKGEATDRLEALARKAGAYCYNQPDLMFELFRETFDMEEGEHFVRVPGTRPQPEVLAPVTPAVTLRRPMKEHFSLNTTPAGEEDWYVTPEATLLMAAQAGYDPAQSNDCGDGGATARQVVTSVLKAADAAGYSRVAALRMVLNQGPYGVETMAAIEHLTGECGVDIILRGMQAMGFNFGENHD